VETVYVDSPLGSHKDPELVLLTRLVNIENGRILAIQTSSVKRKKKEKESK
jgi:hypothetical protein